MKKRYWIYSGFIALALILFQCEDLTNEDDNLDNNLPEEISLINKTTRFEYTTVPEDYTAPVYAINDTSGATTVFYGTFNNNVISRINHISYETSNAFPVVSSFNEFGYLTAITQINIDTGEKIFEYILYADETYTYIKDLESEEFGNIPREKAKSIGLNTGYTFNDPVFQFIEDILAKNSTTIENLNWFINNSSEINSVKSANQTEFIGVAGAVYLVGAALVGVYFINKTGQDNINEKEKSETEEFLLSESPLKKFVDWCNSDGKKSYTASFATGNQSLMCSEKKDDINNILQNKENQNINPCDNSICYTDCQGTVNGSAYWDNCGDCVGGSTGSTPCIEDCSGTPGGSAFLDDCGSCVGGTTGASPCEKDCAGVAGGTAYTDNCGSCVGGTTGADPCEEKDCAGVSGGSAYTDNCGSCVGGTTGASPCEEEDCAGVAGGTAYTDNCGNCVGGSTGAAPCEEEKDCAGVAGGTAYTDACGNCVGGSTGAQPCDTLKRKKFELQED